MRKDSVPVNAPRCLNIDTHSAQRHIAPLRRRESARQRHQVLQKAPVLLCGGRGP